MPVPIGAVLARLVVKASWLVLDITGLLLFAGSVFLVSFMLAQVTVSMIVTYPGEVVRADVKKLDGTSPTGELLEAGIVTTGELSEAGIVTTGGLFEAGSVTTLVSETVMTLVRWVVVVASSEVV